MPNQQSQQNVYQYVKPQDLQIESAAAAKQKKQGTKFKEAKIRKLANKVAEKVKYFARPRNSSKRKKESSKEQGNKQNGNLQTSNKTPQQQRERQTNLAVHVPCILTTP